MRELPLVSVKNQLSALIAEVERTGEPVAITRHGKIVARIVPPETEGGDDASGVLALLIANRNARAKAEPASAEPLAWETLKAEMQAADDAKTASWSKGA